MNRKLTWEQIKTEYPDQWVSLYDLEMDANNELIRAKVFSAALELKDVAQKSKGHNFASHTFRFTGEIKGFLGFSKWDILDVKAG
ncbi:MAG: hypothetical protein JXA66_08760 [Oligoflexia bacterium]|nr:hypothetical protein [Oligoflexia bacterium]